MDNLDFRPAAFITPGRRSRACLAYSVFAAAGVPAPRCNFAAVTVNGDALGLYAHVESIKTAFLERHFAEAHGYLYEGSLSDFRPEFRGTFQKKTRADEADWSDVDAVTAALQDPSPAGLEALAAAVDLDRFLTFWATEVLIGHREGYADNRNNFYLYRAPDADAPLTFIPWGADQAFSHNAALPPSVRAHGAVAHRLYRDDAMRAAYVRRLRELLATVWREEELLARVAAMAAIVQTHAAPHARAAAAEAADRIRRFIRTRRAEILADLDPEPPAWTWPMPSAEGFCRPEIGALDVRFETTWGTNQSANPLAEGQAAFAQYRLDGQDMSSYVRNGEGRSVAGLAIETDGWAETWAESLGMLDASLGNANGVFDREDYAAARAAGLSLPSWDVLLSLDANASRAVDPDEYQAAVLADGAMGKAIAGAVRRSALGVTRCRSRFGRCALIAIVSRGPDSALHMFKVRLPLHHVASNARIDLDLSWSRHHPGGDYVGRNGRCGSIAQGQLEFFEAHAEPGAPITGRLRGIIFGEGGAGASMVPAPTGLAINEVAAQGDPLDWFELYNASADPIALRRFRVRRRSGGLWQTRALPGRRDPRPGRVPADSAGQKRVARLCAGERRRAGRLDGERRLGRARRLGRGPVRRRPELRARTRHNGRLSDRGSAYARGSQSRPARGGVRRRGGRATAPLAIR